VIVDNPEVDDSITFDGGMESMLRTSGIAPPVVETSAVTAGAGAFLACLDRVGDRRSGFLLSLEPAA
jgi:hypothetical protein